MALRAEALRRPSCMWAATASLGPRVVLLLSVQLWHAGAKVQIGSLRFKGLKPQNRWRYLSKFGYAVGQGNYSVRLQLRQPKSLPTTKNVQLEIYLDSDWQAVEALEDVCERGKKYARKRIALELPAAGGWGKWGTGTLSQSIRPHIWYFALSDCSDKLPNMTHNLQFEFQAKQASGSEFSVEMQGMLPANTFFFCGLTIFAWWFWQLTVAFFRSAGSVHPVIWMLSVVVLLHYIAQSLHTVHLWVYRSSGTGIKALEVTSEILFMMSQVMQTTLLVLIGLGYTLLQSGLGELDLMIPVCFMVAIIHVMLVGFGKIKDDASYKFHENEGILGWVLLLMRLLLYFWFLWAVQSSAKEGGTRLQTFLRQFSIIGSMYFLAYPAIFLITKCFAPYWQHGVMSMGLTAMQAASSFWLSRLFLTRGEYFKVSTLSASELPGGCKTGMIKEE